MVRKDQELRPVMTRIPEGLRRRLEREAKFQGRSMNAEIVRRLQISFEIPAIVDDVSSNIDDAADMVLVTLQKRLDTIQSEIRAILARLEGRVETKPDEAKPKDNGETK